MRKYITPEYKIERFCVSMDILTLSDTNDYFLIDNSEDVEFDDDFDW